MYNLLQKYTTVGKYKSPSMIRKKVKNDYFFIHDNILYKNRKENIIRKFSKSISIGFINSNYLLLQEENSYQLYNIYNNTFNDYIFGSAIVIENYFESEYISVLNMTQNESFFGVFNVSQKKYLFKLSEIINIKIVNQNEICGEINNMIMKFSLAGEILWKNNLTIEKGYDDTLRKKTIFSKFIGISDDRLFVLTKNNLIIVLNVNDGSLIKIIEIPTPVIPLNDAFIHPEKKSIYCLGNYFVKINLNTLEVETIKKIAEENTDPNINTILYQINESSFQDGYITFKSSTRHRSGSPKWIGIFDIEQEKMIWHYELLPADSSLSIPAFETPKLAGDKLYVMDTENTLYILERI